MKIYVQEEERIQASELRPGDVFRFNSQAPESHTTVVDSGYGTRGYVRENKFLHLGPTEHVYRVAQPATVELKTLDVGQYFVSDLDELWCKTTLGAAFSVNAGRELDCASGWKVTPVTIKTANLVYKND